MAVKCGHILEWMEDWAPLALAEDWDNPGLLVGDREAEILTVLVALDVTSDVVAEAMAQNADLIITHHPMIFGSISRVTADTALGRNILTLAKYGISAYGAHTNLDRARDGTNDTLARLCGLYEVQHIGAEKECMGMGRMGYLPQSITLKDLSEALKEKLGLASITYVGDPERLVQKVAVCTGAGASLLPDAAAAKADVLLTGDLKFHDAQAALDLGLSVIDATHYGTETIIVPVIAAYLKKRAEQEGLELTVLPSSVNGQPFRYQ